MLENIQKRLFPILQKRNYLSYTELNKYVLMLAVGIVACSVHVLFTLFFTIVGSYALAISHAIGVIVFILACLLLFRRKYDIAGMIISTMIIFSTLATIHTIGGDNFSILYQFVVLLMVMVVPFSNKRIPIAFGILLPIIMVGSYLYDIHHVPVAPIGEANHVLAIMNIIVCASGVVTLLSLERIVRSFIDSFEAQKLRELQNQAYLDHLTGLFNRRYADMYFKEIKRNPPLTESCIAIGDIDDFKTINDTYGHEAGDVTLKMISETIRNNLRKTDLTFRWGGEEFLLIIPNANLKETKTLLEKLRTTIAKATIMHEGIEFGVTITLGATVLDPNNVEKSIDACDKKMYEGKARGKNVVVT